MDDRFLHELGALHPVQRLACLVEYPVLERM